MRVILVNSKCNMIQVFFTFLKNKTSREGILHVFPVLNLVPFLSFPTLLQDMLPAFQVACENMLSKWETHFSSKETCELDVWPYLCTFSADAISRAAFGSNFEEGEGFFKLQKELGALTREVLYSVCIPLLR